VPVAVIVARRSPRRTVLVRHNGLLPWRVCHTQTHATLARASANPTIMTTLNDLCINPNPQDEPPMPLQTGLIDSTPVQRNTDIKPEKRADKKNFF
jgi:hypothetical protein